MIFGKTEDVGNWGSYTTMSLGSATTYERFVDTANAHASVGGCVSRQPSCFVHVFLSCGSRD